MRYKGLSLGTFLLGSTFLMANLSAIIDSFLHPDIPYFDEEHLIVGGISGFLTALLYGIILLYVRRLEQAHNKVRVLRGMLPICGCCKKIRDDKGYWNGVETYITRHSEAVFTSGLCPECAEKMFEEVEKFKKENF